jgi:hypothetical protein
MYAKKKRDKNCRESILKDSELWKKLKQVKRK